MTTYATATVICSVCQTSVTHPVLTSTNELGSRDLDLRPGEMMRGTMDSWVQHCPGCGLCAASLDQPPACAAEVVRTAEYRELLHGATRLPTLARWFRAEAFVAERAHELATAADRALCAAWVCDDAAETEAAIECRNHATALFLRAAGNNGRTAPGVPDPDTLNLLLTDLLRRAGRFDEARARCQLALQASDRTKQAIARFQLVLLDRADTAVHRVDEVVQN